MKYRNTTKTTLLIGPDAVKPGAVTRDYTAREREENRDLLKYIDMGRLVEFKGKVPPPLPPRPVDFRRDDSQVADKPVVDPKTKTVQYIIASSESSDTIHKPDATMHVAKDPTGAPPVDTIEDAFDAGQMKMASDIIEDQLNKDHESSSFDDENMAENEDDLANAPDVDDMMSQDMGMTVRANGKAGARVTNAKVMIQEETSKAVSDMNKLAASNDDEHIGNSGNPRVMEIMRQPFASKKKIIAKETDKSVLGELDRVSNSENLKSLVKQRLAELE